MNFMFFYWKKKLHLSRLFCCSHTCYCVNLVSVTSTSRYITSASRYHPRYHSRSSMYIRGLIPRNFAELAEAVPIDCDSSVHMAHMLSQTGVCTACIFENKRSIAAWLISNYAHIDTKFAVRSKCNRWCTNFFICILHLNCFLHIQCS